MFLSKYENSIYLLNALEYCKNISKKYEKPLKKYKERQEIITTELNKPKNINDQMLYNYNKYYNSKLKQLNKFLQFNTKCQDYIEYMLSPESYM